VFIASSFDLTQQTFFPVIAYHFILAICLNNLSVSFFEGVFISFGVVGQHHNHIVIVHLAGASNFV